MKKNIAAIVMLFLILTAFQPPAPAELTEKDKSDIEAITKIFEESMLARDFDALAKLYTEDAWLMAPNTPLVKGREKIKESNKAGPPFTKFVLNNIEIDGTPDLVYVIGTYELEFELDDVGTISDKGKYFEIRKKQDDGKWLIHRDIYNSDNPIAQP